MVENEGAVAVVLEWDSNFFRRQIGRVLVQNSVIRQTSACFAG